MPGKKADKRRLAKQVKASTKLAKKLVAFDGPEGNVVRAGNDAKGIAQIAFFPAKKTVKVGDTVKFEMSKVDARAPQRRLRPQAVSRRQAVPRAGAQPVRGLPLGRAGHGGQLRRRQPRQRLLQHRALDANKNSPFPSNDSVTFTKAGTYTYYCAVHGNDMKGEIVVQ